MNASQIITDDMTLEEKLTAIEEAMKNAQDLAKAQAAASGQPYVPVDPADATMCFGCQ